MFTLEQFTETVNELKQLEALRSEVGAKIAALNTKVRYMKRKGVSETPQPQFSAPEVRRRRQPAPTSTPETDEVPEFLRKASVMYPDLPATPPLINFDPNTPYEDPTAKPRAVPASPAAQEALDKYISALNKEPS